MASIESILHSLSLPFIFALLLFAIPTFSADSPQSSPSPSPQPPLELISPPPETPSSSPSPAPALPDSPPAPPPSDLAPNSPSPAPSPAEADAASSKHKRSPSPAPSPAEDDGASLEHKKSPSPAPVIAGDISHEDQINAVDLESNDDSGDMSSGKKAGIAIGVIAAACVVGLGALVYKKRRQNIRRAQYSNAARSEYL